MSDNWVGTYLIDNYPTYVSIPSLNARCTTKLWTRNWVLSSCLNVEGAEKMWINMWVSKVGVGISVANPKFAFQTFGIRE